MHTKKVSIIRSARFVPETLSYEKQCSILNSALLNIMPDKPISVADVGACIDVLHIPNLLKQKLETICFGKTHWVHVTGPIEQRVIFFALSESEGLICSLGDTLENVFASRADNVIVSACENLYLGRYSASVEQLHRLLKPRVLLVGLYHPETFPLPRFHLGISDLARSLRKNWLGEVQLVDMQLGASINSILGDIAEYQPDILGISATFGQYDLLEQLLHQLDSGARRPLIIAGGSLAAHLHASLLQSGMVDFVSIGAGESTIVDVAKYWIGEQHRSEIPDVAYRENGVVVSNRRTSNRKSDDILPELDLLDATLSAKGVMQLESSRGCSYACSFCPRSHKGIWAGEHSSAFEIIVPFVSRVFQNYPDTDRRIFLVDEEFVGYQSEELSLGRCLEVTSLLESHGFRCETSSRIDQVYRPRKDKEWHLGRMKFWSTLKRRGLERCLFGVESGVDSILVRFNKKTTALQNIVAIRMLTLLKIPIRCTYITFDPLMSMDELLATVKFLNRKDMVLKRPEHIEEDDYDALYEIAINDDLAQKCSIDQPFYRLVSYMAVSMEALVGSPYLAMVEDAGLAGELNPLMGKRESIYSDLRIGEISLVTQKWVDRNFSLDYTLKSLEKRLPREARTALHDARIQLKDSAFDLIQACIREISLSKGHEAIFSDGRGDFFLEQYMNRVRPQIFRSLSEACETLTGDNKQVLKNQLDVWMGRTDWALINGQCD